MLQKQTKTHISGPSHITGPPQPPKMPEVIQSKKILKQSPCPLPLTQTMQYTLPAMSLFQTTHKQTI